MQTSRSYDPPRRRAGRARGGAHRRPETANTRWWVVTTAILLLTTGVGVATAELTLAPLDSEQVAEGNAAPTLDIDATDSTTSTDRDLDKGSTPTPSETEEPTSHEPTEEPSSHEPVDELAELRADVVALVNDERTAAGCGRVTPNDKLVAAATGHSGDMAGNGYFDHRSRDGRTFTDRAAEQDYHAAIGENIAYGQTSANAVMDSWMNSEGHRANILNCDARAVGMGVAESDDGTMYWTQMFGSAV